MVPSEPARRPRYSPPGLWAQSSITGTLCFCATAMIRSIAAHCPARCTGTIARVRGVIRASSLSGSRLRVLGSTSQKTRLAPRVEKALAVAIQLKGVVITSVPGPTPAAIPARVSPVVAEVTARA